MDWSESLQNAIDYIEEHITEKIDYEEVAKRAYSSNLKALNFFHTLKPLRRNLLKFF